MGRGFQAYEEGSVGASAQQNMTRLKSFAKTFGLPPWIFNTGNVQEICEYISTREKDGEPLSDAAREYLDRTMKTTMRVQEIMDAHVPGTENPERTLREDTNGLELTGIHQLRGQTSHNGCWSSAFQLLLQSRGVSFEQEQIRAYRPAITRKQIMEEGNPAETLTMNGDRVNNIFEVGDLATRMAPDSALHEMQLSVYEPSYGISKEQYLANAKKLISERLSDVLRNEHSPVAFMMNNHYRTIVGMKVKNGREVILYKDSMDKRHPDATHEMYLDDLVKTGLTPGFFNSGGIVFNYFSDLRLSKDGKTLYGMPNVDVSMGADGQVELATQDAIDLDHAERHGNHLEGVTVQQTLQKDLGISEVYGFAVTDSVYLPKKLPAAYLQQAAAARSDEEEQRLKDKDTEAFAHRPMSEKPTRTLGVDPEKEQIEQIDSYFRFVRKKDDQRDAPEKKTRREQPDAVDRSKQMRQYYQGLDESHRLDQLVSLRLMDAQQELTPREGRIANGLSGDFFAPKKPDGSYDVEKIRKRNQLLFERELEAQLEVARKAEDIYDSLSPNLPDRRDLADRLAMESSEGIVYRTLTQMDASVRRGTNEQEILLSAAGLDRTEILAQDYETAKTRFYERLSKKDRELCERGASLSDTGCKAKSIEQLGIRASDYRDLHDANMADLNTMIDRNFLRDETMDAVPKQVLWGTIRDEYLRNRMLDQYHTLDTKEEKLAFLQNAAMMTQSGKLDFHEKQQFFQAMCEYYDAPKTATREALEERVLNEEPAPGKAATVAEAEKGAAWRRPAQAVSEESLDKLANLYDQICGDDAHARFHRNTKSYKNLESALYQINRIRDEQKRSGKPFTPEQLSELVTQMDRVSDAAQIYLKDKAGARSTDIGEERYEIAMAALHVVNAGAAKAMIAAHNEKRSDKKKVSLAELTGREGRTEKEQREHRHSAHSKTKQAEAQQKQ